MAFSVRIAPHHRIGLIQFSGAVDGVVFLDAAQALIDHEAWRPGFDEVWDLMAVTSLSVTPAEMQQAAQFEHLHAERLGPGRAVAVSSRFYVRMLHRLFAALTPKVGRQHLSASTPAEAAHLLGHEPEVLEQLRAT